MHVIFVVGHTAGRYLLGDKEIAVRIRGNSHYRNSVCKGKQSSRNAYRFVHHKGLLGDEGSCVKGQEAIP